MSEINGTLGFDRDQMLAICGKAMYNGDIVDIATKELTQNGFDAIKIAKHMGLISKGVLKIDINTYQRTVSVSDNGVGMTPEILLKAFFTVGGSYKGEDSAMDNRLKSGGLGMAKVAFLFSSEWIEVTTVSKGQKSYFHVTPQEIKDGFKIQVSSTTEANGTTVTVKIPEAYYDENGEKQIVWMPSRPSFLNKPMIGDVDVIINGKTENKSSLPPEYISIGTARANFGDLDIYIKPASRSNVLYEVLCSGLYQFQKSCCYGDGKGLEIVVNILPSVGVRSALYPINNQREGFRSTCKEVKDLEALFEKIKVAYTNGKYAAAFNSCTSMDVRELSSERRIPYDGEVLQEAISDIKETLGVITPEDFNNILEIIHAIKENDNEKSSLDTSGILLPKVAMIDTSAFDLRKPVFHNNTTMTLGEDVMPFLKEFGALLLEVKDLYLQTYETSVRKIGTWGDEIIPGVRMANQYWGVSFDKNYQGVNVKPKVFNFIGINPFGHTIPIYKGVNPSVIIAEKIIHVIIHELNHNYVSGEGSSFTGELVTTEAEFVGIGPLYEEWKKKLYTLVADNLPLIVEYHKRYKSSSNRGESLSS